MPAREPGSRRFSNGFTVIELMVAVVVLAVLVTLVAPTFVTTIKNNRLYTQSNDLYLALMRARSEALTRVQRVTVCASSNGTTCGGNWHDGWLVYVENSDPNNAQVDPSDGDVILEVQEALTGDNTLKGTTDVAAYISYVGTGFTAKAESGYPTQTGTLLLCDDRGKAKGRAIRINAAGRPRVFEASATSYSSCDPTST